MSEREMKLLYLDELGSSLDLTTSPLTMLVFLALLVIDGNRTPVSNAL